MVASRVHLPLVEFYITNVCNFNCSGCNRFNNYTFAGSSRWSDYRETYKKWSQRLTFTEATVLGGEPMICPDYRDWLLGLREIWPETTVTLLTNGSLLKDSDQKLYDILRSDPKIKLAIGLHNKFRRDEVLAMLYRWLQSPVKTSRTPTDISLIEGAIDAWNRSYSNIKDPNWPAKCSIEEWKDLPGYIQTECRDIHGFSPEIFLDSIQSFSLKDVNGVEVTVHWENFFHQGALIFDQNTGRFRLHRSNAVSAHTVCHSKFCHHMERGKLYKCGQVSLFPQFYNQFHMDVSAEELDTMHAYLAATPDMDSASWKKWIRHLENPIPQCTFCPEAYTMSEIYAEPKKMFIQKKQVESKYK